MDSPFQYGKLAMGSTFVNRVNEKRELKGNLYSGINTMLISPRRWGKSSLVKEAMTELLNEHSDVKVCYIDAFTIRSEEEFYQVFAKEVVKSTSKNWESWISTAKEYLKALSPRISIGSDPINDFSIGFELHNMNGNEFDLLNLPQKIAENKGVKIIVCIDEFQNLAGLKGYDDLEHKMRSVWQKHNKVSYCLYGSKRHMMIDIFNSSSKPFYRFGQIMFLPKIAENEWVRFIVDSFEHTGKQISEKLATELVQKVNLHSWYVQQLAHFTWNLTVDRATEEILQTAVDQIINTNLPLFQNECEALTVSQLNLLIAIVKGEKAFTSTSVMSKYRLGTPQNVSKNKTLLQKRDLIDKTPEGFVFLDPVFERWFVLEYANLLN
ncbi:MAG: ATP-binding protein [Bacteroidales bacterium]